MKIAIKEYVLDTLHFFLQIYFEFFVGAFFLLVASLIVISLSPEYIPYPKTIVVVLFFCFYFYLGYFHINLLFPDEKSLPDKYDFYGITDFMKEKIFISLKLAAGLMCIIQTCAAIYSFWIYTMDYFDINIPLEDFYVRMFEMKHLPSVIAFRVLWAVIAGGICFILDKYFIKKITIADIRKHVNR